ncbi:hypothetical protein QJS10_CPB11g01073 [Acorus calamus]|uniref:Uncharacterized protein n=1 Tax=Acorus calamus TaxID=4465 RepID=A0AAV9DT37_ACOCL|nr:hypothetical protein QJS10_CPB11g01073 [Acorus calamus]
MKKETHLVTDAASAKLTSKVSPGMEGAYKYISSLTTVSTYNFWSSSERASHIELVKEQYFNN